MRNLRIIRCVPRFVLLGAIVFALNSCATEHSNKTVTSRATQRYLLYGAPWDGCAAPQFKPLVNKAADVGFNAIRIVVNWRQHQNRAGECDFAALDEALDYVVKTKRLKAVVMIWLTRPPEPIQKGNDTVLLEKDLQRNSAGQISSMFSFNSDHAAERAADFVERVVAHCHARYPDEILCYITPFSQFAETEYWCKGEWGYEELSRQAYRAWLAARYGTIGELNRAWKSTYASFDQIQPSRKGDAPGLDWYRFRHAALKRAIHQVAAAVQKGHPEARHALQFGSTFDGLVDTRCTACFPDLCTRSHVVWVDDAAHYNHCFSMDYMRSSLPGKWICNEIDAPSRGSDEEYYRQAKESFEHGASMISVANWPDLAELEKRAGVFRSIARDFLAAPVPEKKPVATITIKASEARRGTGVFQRRYNELSSNGTNWVRVLLDDDVSVQGGNAEADGRKSELTLRRDTPHD